MGSTAERPASEHLLSFFPDIPLTIDDYIKERREKQDLAWPSVRPLPGVVKLVNHLAKHKIPIAVATGSMRRNYVLKTTHLPELFDLFEGKVVCGDDPRLQGRGKPNPDVFLLAAEILGKKVGMGDVTDLTSGDLVEERARGLIFEDATNGVQAGKRAGMNGGCKCVAPPEVILTMLPFSGLGA